MLQLTEGKTYNAIIYKDDYELHMLTCNGNPLISIIDDDLVNTAALYPAELFKPLYIIRDEKLNELGI